MFKKSLKKYIPLLLLLNVIIAIMPPQDGRIPTKYQEFFKQNGIGTDYGNTAWQSRLHNRKLSRSTEVDSFFIPVIMGNYTDLSGSIPAATYSEHLFGINPTGSFSDYYKEVSNGKFYPTGDVYGWYNTAKSKSEAVTDPVSFVTSTLTLCDSDIDFRKYDNDGPDNVSNSGDDDGYVDGLIIIFPGKSAAAGDSYGDENNIWPFASYLQADEEYKTDDVGYNGVNIKVHDYTLCPEKFGNDIHTIGVYVHEFGHILGLPDLYDMQWNSTDPLHNTHEGIGVWGLMASGGWLGNSGDTPSHFSAWSKVKLGWANPIEITSGSYLLTPVLNNGMIYKIIGSSYNVNPSGYNSEYFLLENRQKNGFDKDIPSDGMLIFHIDESIQQNTDQNHKKVDLEEADGYDDLDNNNNNGDAGDPYPGSSYNTAFSMSSYPNNYSYYDISSIFEITNISKSGEDVEFAIQTNIIDDGKQIRYDTDLSYEVWGWDTERDIYAGVLFQSEISGSIKGIDIRLPGIWEQNSYDDWNYVDKNHLFEIFIYQTLDANGYTQNLLFSTSISYTGQGWYRVNIDIDLPVTLGQEFFAGYKIPDGTHDIYVDGDRENLSNRSYADNSYGYYIPIPEGNITLRAWIEPGSTQTIIGDINQDYALEIGDIISLINYRQNGGISCVNDDYTEDKSGDTCSSWFDANASEDSSACTIFDDDDFTASEMCCVCGGGYHYGSCSACDINSDSKVNILDVIDLVYIILNP